MSDSSNPTKSQPHRPARRPHICPEPGSLYDIMHTYSGNALYVPPICWTDLHIKSLNVQFQELPRVTRPSPEPCRNPDFPPPPPPEPSPAARYLCSEVSTFVDPSSTLNEKVHALKEFMSDFFPDMQCKTKTGLDLDLYFGSRKCKAAKVPIVWKRADSSCYSFDSAPTRPTSSSSQETASSQEPSQNGDSQATTRTTRSSTTRNALVLAYVDRAHLATVRRTLFRVVPGPRSGDFQNTPVANLQRLRAKALIPSDPDRDAHYAAILLAMAQSRFYNKISGRPKFRVPSSQTSSHCSQSSATTLHDVEVSLITRDAEGDNLVVYKALVGADFLEGFARPAQTLHRRPELSSSMRIQYTKVAIWPFYGLKERLGQALGQEVTGQDFDGLQPFDTFHTADELPLYEAELERIRLDEERRYRDYQSAWREEQQHRLRQILQKSFDGEGKKKRKSDGADLSADRSSPSKRRRGGVGVTEVEVC